jgi:HD-GYP domain-containing protein (c-di-GMP phosphodiesterase class II)
VRKKAPSFEEPPISTEGAIAELRRVSGTQLDPHFVELFIGVLEGGNLGFTHTEDADFEAELALERRIAHPAHPRRTV